ncbi:hypothetical protein GCM10028777_10270 [Angustibacter speluncae]
MPRQRRVTHEPNGSQLLVPPQVTAGRPDVMPPVARAGLWFLWTSVGCCLLLLYVAAVAGAELRVVAPDGDTVPVTFGSVVITLLVADLTGVTALAVLGRRSRRAWTTVAVAGLAVGLASAAVPLAAEAGALTTVVLVAMHVTAALLWFAVLVSLLPRR